MSSDPSSWLPGLTGPIDLQQSGVSLNAARGTWNFVGIAITDNGLAADSLTFTVSSTARASVTTSSNHTVASTEGDVFAALGSGGITLKLQGPTLSTAPVADESHSFIDRDFAASVAHPLTIDGQGNQIRQRDGSLAATFVVTTPGDSVTLMWNGSFWNIR